MISDNFHLTHLTNNSPLECYRLSVGESVRAWAGEEASLECEARSQGGQGGQGQGSTSIIWLRDREEAGAGPEIIAHNDNVLYPEENKFLVNVTRLRHITVSKLTVCSLKCKSNTRVPIIFLGSQHKCGGQRPFHLHLNRDKGGQGGD